MIQSLIELLRSDPVLLLFMVLGAGYEIGGIRIGSFQLGEVAGVLLAGLLLGHFCFEGNDALQSLGFVLFIFSVGYEAGPKFVQAIRRDSRRYLALAVIIAAVGFALSLGAARLFGFGPRVSAGVMAGALTSTPTLAAADAAVAAGDYVPPGGWTVDMGTTYRYGCHVHTCTVVDF